MHWKPVRKYYAKRWRERAARKRSLSEVASLMKGKAKKILVTLELRIKAATGRTYVSKILRGIHERV